MTTLFCKLEAAPPACRMYKRMQLAEIRSAEPTEPLLQQPAHLLVGCIDIIKHDERVTI